MKLHLRLVQVFLYICFISLTKCYLFFLQAYSSLSPIVHMVDIQNGMRESHANITVYPLMITKIGNLESICIVLQHVLTPEALEKTYHGFTYI